MSLFSGYIFASVNMTNSNAKSPKSGFHGGVFYISKDHKEISNKILAQHNAIKKALIYSPETDYIKIEPEKSLTLLNQQALTFSEIAIKFQN
jgi:hypothetical protein